MPSTPCTTLICLEQNMNSLCGAGDVESCVAHLQLMARSKMPQERPITISDLNVVPIIISLYIKVCELYIDEVTLGNFNSSYLAEIVRVVSQEKGRGQCCIIPPCPPTPLLGLILIQSFLIPYFHIIITLYCNHALPNVGSMS